MEGVLIMNMKSMMVASETERLEQSKYGGEGEALLERYSLELLVHITNSCHCCLLQNEDREGQILTSQTLALTTSYCLCCRLCAFQMSTLRLSEENDFS